MGTNLLVAFLLPLYMTARNLLKVLKQNGWIKKSQSGSHLQLIHPVKKGKVTVPIHSGDIPRGTLNSILKQAGLK
jgi:predicted RNA binding protein YcfA (HicA-like mRNA interferase family)